MNVKIYNRELLENMLIRNSLDNVAVISFYDPDISETNENKTCIDFSHNPIRVFTVALYEIDAGILSDYGLTYDTYFPEAEALAKFIYSAYNDGLDIICQSSYCQGRSAACAAAILEHFHHQGIPVFSNSYDYPNPIVFHKILDALEQFASEETITAEKDRKSLPTSPKHNEKTIVSHIKDIFVLTDDYYIKFPNSDKSFAGIIAYVDLATNELKKISKNSILLFNTKTKNYHISDKIESNCIYHLKAYYVKTSLFDGDGSSFGLAVTEIIEKNAPNKALEHLLEKYNTPFKTTDNVVGDIIFSRCHLGFCGMFDYCKQHVELTVEEKDIWTEEIKKEHLDKLHILLNCLEDMREHILDNSNKKLPLHSLRITDGFQNYITIGSHMSFHQQKIVTLEIEIWINNIENDNDIDLFFSKQEFLKFLDAWNTII